MKSSIDQGNFASQFLPQNLNPLKVLQNRTSIMKNDLYPILGQNHRSELQKRASSYMDYDITSGVSDPQKKFKPDSYHSSSLQQKNFKISSNIQNSYPQLASDKLYTGSYNQNHSINSYAPSNENDRSRSNNRQMINNMNKKIEIIILDDSDDEDCLIIEQKKPEKQKELQPTELTKEKKKGLELNNRITEAKHLESMEALRQKFFKELQMRELAQSMAVQASSNIDSNPYRQVQQSLIYSNPYLINSLNQIGLQNFSLLHRQALQDQLQKEQSKLCLPVMGLDEKEETETNFPEGSSNSALVEGSFEESELIVKEEIQNPPININSLDEKKETGGKNYYMTHQAVVPNFYLNRNNKRNSGKALKLVWNPDEIQQDELDKYLMDLSKITRKEIINQEVALKVLKNYDMNVSQALSIVRRNKISYRDHFQIKERK